MMKKVASQLDPADKAKISTAVEDTTKWLDQNQLAEVEELEHKQKELEGICNPIITKMYQASGAPPEGPSFPGAPGGAPPGASPQSTGRSGPTVEEVD